MTRIRRPARVAAAAALSGALVLALTACSGGANGSDSDTPVAGGTLNVVRANPFEGFDLDKASLNSTYQISQAVLEPLVRVAPDGKGLEPGLATSWAYSNGNKLLTLELDPEATFSNGDPVTAEDVAFSVDTWKAGPNYGASFASIARTEVVDEHTVALHLSAPDTGILTFLSWAIAGVVPKDFAGMEPAEFWQKPIGAGAFTVDRWSGTGEVVLKKNPDYYVDGQPYVDEVVSTFSSDPNSVTLQLQSGQIDMADEILPVTAATLPKKSVSVGIDHLTSVLLMNTKAGALADVEVRRAIAQAIDYEAISASALKGYGSEPDGPLPPNVPNWAPPSAPYFSHDVAKAKADLAKATQKPDTLELVYPNDASSSVMAQVIQQNLADIGIELKLRSADSSTTFGAFSSGSYELAIFSNNAISPDAADPAWYIVATGTMFTQYPTDKALEILDGYSVTDDVEKKKAAITQLQDLWTSEVPFVALSHQPALEAIRSDAVHGADVTPWGVYRFDTVWKSQ